MNLVEVSNPRKHINSALNNDFPPNPPWDIGFSELPDTRNQLLSVTQYRDGEFLFFVLYYQSEYEKAI